MLRHHFSRLSREVDDGDDFSTVGECDALFATSWTTAYPVRNAKIEGGKFYFVQDFEPSFYPVGSESVLAENTYRFGLYGITAGGWLSKKLEHDYGMQCDHFEFGSDFGRYYYVNSGHRSKVFFYARPVTTRRGFELGVLALDRFHRAKPEYEINMAGWPVKGWQLPFPFVPWTSSTISTTAARPRSCSPSQTSRCFPSSFWRPDAYRSSTTVRTTAWSATTPTSFSPAPPPAPCLKRCVRWWISRTCLMWLFAPHRASSR